MLAVPPLAVHQEDYTDHIMPRPHQHCVKPQGAILLLVIYCGSAGCTSACSAAAIEEEQCSHRLKTVASYACRPHSIPTLNLCSTFPLCTFDGATIFPHYLLGRAFFRVVIVNQCQCYAEGQNFRIRGRP